MVYAQWFMFIFKTFLEFLQNFWTYYTRKILLAFYAKWFYTLVHVFTSFLFHVLKNECLFILLVMYVSENFQDCVCISFINHCNYFWIMADADSHEKIERLHKKCNSCKFPGFVKNSTIFLNSMYINLTVELYFFY